ncbi:hypothetical protein [Methanofollis ethanolicus]|uniref:hypothetical protein n=1 Tax=Methanofollis ethanolicus TaxID=488124 RepID=UPI0008358DE5|nr:hypothetical protein [Methanofollis ethanolicus]
MSGSAATAARTTATAAKAAAKSAASNPLVKTAAAATGAAAAGAAVLSSQNETAKNAILRGIKTNPVLLPASIALNAVSGLKSSAVSSSTGGGTTTTSTLTTLPDFSYSAVLKRISSAWDPETGSVEAAAGFMAESPGVTERQVIANTLGVGNAGNTLYKTIYTDGGYEIRSANGQIVSSGSAGAAYAQTPDEKAAATAAYQAKNQAMMQARADKGDGAAKAWLKRYGNPDGGMYDYAHTKVMPGQTDSTTKILYRQSANAAPESRGSDSGDVLSGIMGAIGSFLSGGSGSEEKVSSSPASQSKGTTYSYGILGGSLAAASGGYDEFYRAKSSLYDTAFESAERGDYAKTAAAGIPAVAVDVVAPLGLMQVGNKILSGRAGEITQDELLDGGMDAALLAFGAFTGGTGYFAGKALKTAIKTGALGAAAYGTSKVI